MVIFAHAGHERTREGSSANPHSAPIPNSLMSGHHFSESAFTSAPSFSGRCWSRGKISAPNSPIRARTFGSANASTTAALSLLMISLGSPPRREKPSPLGVG